MYDYQNDVFLYSNPFRVKIQNSMYFQSPPFICVFLTPPKPRSQALLYARSRPGRSWSRATKVLGDKLELVSGRSGRGTCVFFCASNSSIELHVFVVDG